MLLRDTPVSAKSVLAAINKNFGTLPFCRRYLDRAGETNYLYGVSSPIKAFPSCLIMTKKMISTAPASCERRDRAGLSSAEGSGWIYDGTVCGYWQALTMLMNSRILTSYQEHTILLRPTVRAVVWGLT